MSSNGYLQFQGLFSLIFQGCFSNRIKQLLENLKFFIHGKKKKKTIHRFPFCPYAIAFYLKSPIEVLNHQFHFFQNLKNSQRFIICSLGCQAGAYHIGSSLALTMLRNFQKVWCFSEGSAATDCKVVPGKLTKGV